MENVDFVAIDVETANADMASICQLGIAQFKQGALTEEWKTYVDPEDYFDGLNVSIHGIDEDTVEGAPTFRETLETLRTYLHGNVVVCHTHFDRVALNQASQRYEACAPECIWLDSARVARRTWHECAWSGYGLLKVCEIIGYTFKHHDALEDAKAAAQVLLAAIAKTGLDVNGWLKRVRQPIDPSRVFHNTSPAIKRDGNPEGALYGEILVFTGALEIPRCEAADLAAAIGCQVAPSVSKKTTLLVVGDQDVKKLAGHEKSAKHRKAEELIGKGAAIRILKESDFRELVKYSNEFSTQAE